MHSTATRSSLPMLVACLLVVGAGLVAAAIPLPPGIAWVAALTGAATVLAGVALALHAAFLRPESLRSEARTEIIRPATAAPNRD